MLDFLTRLHEVPEANINKLHNIFNKKGYWFPKGKDYDVCLFSIRMEKSFRPEYQNLYTDITCLVYSYNNRWYFFKAPITTLPGNNTHTDFDNPLGMGIIIPNQYRGVYTEGLSKGRDELVQCGNFQVARDMNADGIFDLDNVVIATPENGFNYHNAISSNPEYKDVPELVNIGNFSKGCQVQPNRLLYQLFLDTIKYSMTKYGDKISYTLLEEKDFKEVL